MQDKTLPGCLQTGVTTNRIIRKGEVMLTGNIKAYVAGILAALLLLVLIPTGIHNFALQAQVEQLETDKTTLVAESMIKKMEVTGLMNSLGDQEKRIQAFEATAKQMAEARVTAQKEAATRIQSLENQIDWLTQDKGASCNAAGIGTAILKEVLP